MACARELSWQRKEITLCGVILEGVLKRAFFFNVAFFKELFFNVVVRYILHKICHFKHFEVYDFLLLGKSYHYAASPYHPSPELSLPCRTQTLFIKQ